MAKILIVEDEPDIALGLGDDLTLDGHEVEIVGDGDSAVRRGREPQWEAIVLDVMLPDINGKEVCHRVRSDITLEEVRIICISGMCEPDKIEDLKASGANEFLQKPFEAEVLVDRICSLLDIETGVAGSGS